MDCTFALPIERMPVPIFQVKLTTPIYKRILLFPFIGYLKTNPDTGGSQL